MNIPLNRNYLLTAGYRSHPSRSAVGTLVERTSRLVLLLHLDGQRSADAAELAMRKAIRTLPAELCRTITWDQGAEMSNHARFTIKTSVPIYFCDPHAPWQRVNRPGNPGGSFP